MRLKPARYLLRFDDLCPTMSRTRWEPFLAIITRYRLRPLLAVVPDNQDPHLRFEDPDPRFWEHMRALQAAGATIAMHGYRHLCASRGKPFIALHQETEFAGIDEQTQREWIRAGLAILRGQGLQPRLFVAPRHGFDRATLRALVAEGLGFLSDGFATRPSTRGKVVWIPQQLWGPVTKNTGLWTICIHTNTAHAVLEKNLDAFVQKFAEQMICFDDLLRDDQFTALGWAERLTEWLALQSVRSR